MLFQAFANMNRYIVKYSGNGKNFSAADKENGLAVLDAETADGYDVIADVTGNPFYSDESIRNRKGHILNLEIERKWLVKIPENINDFHFETIEQDYLAPESGFRGRIRKLDDKFIYTEKAPTADPKVRIENERFISREEYLSLKEKTVGNTIKKRRYLIPYGGLTFELDVFENNADKDYALMEAELEHKNDKAELPPYVEVVQEVTNDMYYTNRNLSDMKIIRLLKK